MSWYRYLVKGVEVESGHGLLRADVSGRDGVQVAHPDQVVGGSSKGEGHNFVLNLAFRDLAYRGGATPRLDYEEAAKASSAVAGLLWARFGLASDALRKITSLTNPLRSPTWPTYDRSCLLTDGKGVKQAT
jgi:hypothetical protein